MTMRRRYARRADTRLVLSAVAAGLVLAYALHSQPHAAASGTATAGASTSTASASVALGERMAASYGWTGGQWDCLDWLWTRESGWNDYAANPTSDARGIPQDINGWSDYAPGDAAGQIRWGLAYIQGRYGTPCAAWSHETADSWY